MRTMTCNKTRRVVYSGFVSAHTPLVKRLGAFFIEVKERRRNSVELWIVGMPERAGALLCDRALCYG
jgi:hypothetical protein